LIQHVVTRKNVNAITFLCRFKGNSCGQPCSRTVHNSYSSITIEEGVVRNNNNTITIEYTRNITAVDGEKKRSSVG
jgi:hypothetical protein